MSGFFITRIITSFISLWILQISQLLPANFAGFLCKQFKLTESKRKFPNVERFPDLKGVQNFTLSRFKINPKQNICLYNIISLFRIGFEAEFTQTRIGISSKFQIYIILSKRLLSIIYSTSKIL